MVRVRGNRRERVLERRWDAARCGCSWRRLVLTDEHIDAEMHVLTA